MNGIESPIGSTDYDLAGGDRIWWDYRDWTAAMRVPAVVGSWPEPFVHGFQGTALDAGRSLAEGAVAPCNVVEPALTASGARTSGLGDSDGTADIVVGTWSEIRHDPSRRRCSRAARISSGVFARFVGGEKPLLELLNQQGQPAGSIGKGGGLIAALRPGDGPPIWVVTGTDAKGVAAAAALVGPALRNHYAVATQPGAGAIGVPVQ